MASIFAKARTVFLSSVHSLLDTAIDLDSPGAIRQHVRDLESARNKLADEAAITNGQAVTLEKEIIDLNNKKKTTEENIDLLLGDDDAENDHHAMPLAEMVLRIDEDVASKQGELVDKRALAANLEEARAKLSAKHGDMLRSLNRLESMERAAAAREQAASAINQAAETLGGVDSTSVDNVARRIHDRDAVAKARFERALADIDEVGSADAVRESAAAAFIASRRNQLDKKSAAGEKAA